MTPVVNDNCGSSWRITASSKKSIVVCIIGTKNSGWCRISETNVLNARGKTLSASYRSRQIDSLFVIAIIVFKGLLRHGITISL